MKKIYFFAALAAVALASCSNDETVAQYQGEAISFRPLMNSVTRSSSTADVTTFSGGSFYVTAITNDATPVTYISDIEYKDNSGVYFVDANAATNKYANEYYWPSSSTLDFYAYNKPTTGVSNQTYKSYVLTPPTTSDATFSDVVYATIQDIGKNTSNGNSSTYGAAGVPLNFRHTASKISVNVKNTAQKLKFEIEGWKVAFLHPSGTFTLSETSTANSPSQSYLAFGDWAQSGTKAVTVEYVSTFTPQTINANTTSATNLATELANTVGMGSMILVPQRITAATAYTANTANGDGITSGEAVNNSYIAVKMKIKDATSGIVIADNGSGEAIWVIWPIGDNGGETPFNWLPGKHYTYTIDLAGGGYYEKNNKDINPSSTALDPVLDGAVIKFVDVTVDSWDPVAESVAMP